MGFDQVLPYIALHRRQEVSWSHVDLEDPFFLNLWRQGKGIGFADKHVHEHKNEVDGQFVYHESRLRVIEVRFKDDVHMSSTDNAIAETWEVIGDKQPDPAPGGVIVSVLPAVTTIKVIGTSETSQQVGLLDVNNIVR